MLQSSIPAKFSVPFANNAGAGFIRPIPAASQIGINPGFASLTDGFPPLNFQPIAAGGIPPFGQDLNGVLNQITQWSQWQGAGGPVIYDGAFATAIGGYPRGSILASALVFGNQWLSTADNNTTDPDSSSAANWISPPGVAGTGTLGFTVIPSGSAPPGWLFAGNNRTIGNPTSGAGHANVDAAPLYTMLWNAFSNSTCPVTGGRGANPAADFAAGKPMQILDLFGTGIVGQDAGTNRLFGVPIISGGINTLGSLLGENLHSLISLEIPGHTHNGSGTTSLENVNHNHSGSGTTSGQNVDHTHNVAGTTGSENQNHTHPYSAGPNGLTYQIQTGGASGFNPTAATTGIESAAHNHNLNIQSGGSTNDHSHTYGFTTGTESTGHAHTYNFTTDNGTGGGAAHNNLIRSMAVNWLLKL